MLKVEGKHVANPLVITDRWVEDGMIVYGAPKKGDEAAKGKALLKSGEVDLGPLDDAVDNHAGKLLLTFPNCTLMTIQQLRKKKLLWWNQNMESNRQWLGQNMMTEAKSGFQAFNEGNKEIGREIDFVLLRQKLAEGAPWTDELQREISPQYKK